MQDSNISKYKLVLRKNRFQSIHLQLIFKSGTYLPRKDRLMSQQDSRLIHPKLYKNTILPK